MGGRRPRLTHLFGGCSLKTGVVRFAQLSRFPFWPHSWLVYGGDLVSTGVLGGCLRVGVVWGLVNKPGETLIGESNYAMAA